MPVPLPTIAFALGASFLGTAFLSADAALGSLSSARVSALLEQADLPYRSALERYRGAPWRLRATYVVGRVVCAALTAALFVDVMKTVADGHLGTFLGVLVTVALYAPMNDVAIAISRRRADTWGLRLATLLAPFELFFWPLAAVLASVSERVADRVENTSDHDPEVLSAEVEYLVDEVERSGVVGAEPAEMIRNVLEFADRKARDVMVPRGRIEGIDIATDLDEVRAFVADSGHSRYPVYDGQLDNIVGILCAKDFFKLVGSESRARAVTLSELVRPDIIFVAEQQKLSTLLKEMRHKRQHLAVVVDEFGATSGMVTLEDVIEEIVGDINDEHDEAEVAAPIEELGDGRLLASATLPLSDVAAYLGIDLPADLADQPLSKVMQVEGEEADAQQTCEVGQSVERWGLTFTVREAVEGAPTRLEIGRPVQASWVPPPVTSRRASAPALASHPPDDEDGPGEAAG